MVFVCTKLYIYLILCMQVSVFADSLIPTVRRALVDPLFEVRSAAAHTFDNLHHNIGQRALDEILPYLLQQLVSDILLDIGHCFKISCNLKFWRMFLLSEFDVLQD